MGIDKKRILSEIRRNVDSAPSPAPEPPPIAPAPPRLPAPAHSGTAKNTAFWLDAEDRQLFQELSIFLYSHGIKPSNNLLLRAALRLVPRDHQLVDQVNSLLAKDGRKLRHQSP